jgi:DNA modification methylase
LRDYGTATWSGGDGECDHAVRENPRVESSTLGGGKATTGHQRERFKGACPRCGARRIDAQIGVEATPAEYVAQMVDVFREVRRTLRDDGTLWLNLGDSYASQGGPEPAQTKWQVEGASDGVGGGRSRIPGALKPKDLIGIPWRVAFALQADGWWLRQDIIWSKPNPMPESVRDRCTKSHEYLFLLAKSENYYYDAGAIAEPAIYAGKEVVTNGNDGMAFNVDGNRTRDGFRRGVTVRETRNKRSVWTVTTQPYSEAHFATFPPALIEPCIAAGCPVGGLVLDPFGGSGTTGQVAEALGRKWLLIELNGEYSKLAADRPRQIGMELA